MSSDDPLVEIDFDPDLADEDVTYGAIGALADMAMSVSGATIAELDLCDNALREIVAVANDHTVITRAGLCPVTGALSIHTDSPVEIPQDSLELIELGLGPIDSTGTAVHGMLAYGRSQS